MTADEIWRQLPGPREASVHLAEFPGGLEGWIDESLDARWTRLLGIRDVVNLALEGARQRKEIGTALAAQVTIRASTTDLELLERYSADLPMLFITSAITIEAGTGPTEAIVSRAAGEKCPRCWRIVELIVEQGDATGLCERCADAVGRADAAAS